MMKKIFISLLCMMMLSGCSAANNLYDSEDLITENVYGLKYDVPESWKDSADINENNIYYYDDGLMLMVQRQDYDFESFDGLNNKEKDSMIETISDQFSSGFNGYREIERKYIDFCGTSAMYLSANVELNEYNYLECLMFSNNYKIYSILLTSNSKNQEVNKEMVRCLLETVEFVVPAKFKISRGNVILNNIYSTRQH